MWLIEFPDPSWYFQLILHHFCYSSLVFSYGHTAAMEKFPVRHGVPRWPQPSCLLCEMGVVPGPDIGAEGWESLCKASDTALGRSLSESPLAWLLCSKTVLGERRKPTQSPPAQIWIWAPLLASSQTLSRLLSFAHWITLASLSQISWLCMCGSPRFRITPLIYMCTLMLTPHCLKVRSYEAPTSFFLKNSLAVLSHVHFYINRVWFVNF